MPPRWLGEATAKALREVEIPTSGDVVADPAHSLPENITRVNFKVPHRTKEGSKGIISKIFTRYFSIKKSKEYNTHST